jgi:hypothetical protein
VLAPLLNERSRPDVPAVVHGTVHCGDRFPRGEEREMEIRTQPEIRRLLDAADEPVRTLLLCARADGHATGRAPRAPVG